MPDKPHKQIDDTIHQRTRLAIMSTLAPVGTLSFVELRAQLGLSEQFRGVKNPFPWMSEIMDLKKEKNFFETRVTEYQTGGALSWD